MTHFTEDDLARYAFDPDGFAERARLEEHIETCDSCRQTVDFIHTVDTALAETTPWDVATDLEKSEPLPPPLSALAEQVESERLRAHEILAPHAGSLDRFRAAAIETNPAFHDTGVVRVLTELAERNRLRQPQLSLAFADAAIAIGERLQRSARLRSNAYLGDAWKERAVALGVVGRFREAEEAATSAEQAYVSDPHATEHDQALIQIIRANVCVATDRIDEAERLAASAAVRFRTYGDIERYLSARVLQGNVRYKRRDYAAAAGIFEEIVGVARKYDLTVVLARALANAGESRACLGDYARAREHFAECCVLWKQLGHETDRIRANWSLANILLNTGRIDEAIEGFESVYREYDAIGVINDAALARLQLAEALLVAGRGNEVAEVLEGVVVSFSAEGLMRNANMALAYIREAVADQTLEADLVRDVRLYLEELPDAPERIFMRS